MFWKWVQKNTFRQHRCAGSSLVDDLDYSADVFGSYVERKWFFSRRNNKGKSEISNRENYRKKKNN